MNDIPKTKLSGLEAMRGIAASLVVLHHAGNIITQPRFYGVSILDHHLANFNVGIDFFFVLSGFIISWIHWGDLGQPQKLLPYVQKRFFRIYPVYWVILIPLIISYFVLPDSGKPEQRDALNILYSILLLPNTLQPVLGVAWTLVHEVFFYAIFGLLIWFGRRMIWLLWAWAALVAFVHILQIKLYLPLGFFTSSFNLEFLAGVALAVWLRSNTLPRPRLILWSGVAIFIGFMLFHMHVQDIAAVGRLVFGSASVMIIAGLVELERAHGWRFSSPWLLLGSASYALYLIHPVILSAVINLGFKFGVARSVSPEIAVMVLTIISVIGGIAFHLLIENRLRQVIGKWTKSAHKSHAAPQSEPRP